MFRFIRRWREKRRGLKRILCPSCGRKFWDCLPTAQTFKAFHAHCPRCGVIVDDSNVTESRRQIAARWGAAVARAAWNCLAYPVRPLAAHRNIVRLEAKVVEEVAKVELKIEKQGEALFKRVDAVQEGMLVAIGRLIGRTTAERPLLLEAPLTSFDMPPPGSEFKFQTKRQDGLISCRVNSRRTYVDTETLESGCSHVEFFLTRCSKPRSEAEFDGDYQLSPEGMVAFIRSIHFQATADASPDDLREIFDKGFLSIDVQQYIETKLPLASLLSGDMVMPYSCELVIPGGRNFQFRLEFAGGLMLKAPVKLKVICSGFDGALWHASRAY